MKRLPFLFSFWVFAVNWHGLACGKVAYFGSAECALQVGTSLLETHGIAEVQVVNRNNVTREVLLK